MPIQFKYQAVSEDGLEEEGVFAAESSHQVIDHLAQQHLIPVSIEQIRATQPFAFWGFFRGTQYENLIMFTNNLRTMYRAGVPILRTLDIIRIGPPESRFNYAVTQMKLSLESGHQLSTSMEEFDDLFPRFYIASIAAGEESGKLDDILDELSDMLEKEMELTRQIKSGVRYPSMVVTALIAASIVMMTFVVPRFVEFYAAFDAELPVFTRLLIGASNFMAQYWPAFVAFLVVSVFVFRKLASQPKTRLVIDRSLLRLPVIGTLVVKGNVARFSLLFRILIQSGLPIVKSLDILIGSIKNSLIASEIGRLKELFSEGKDNRLLSEKFEGLPRLARQMIVIGLESGSLEKMLAEVGNHYSKEVQYMSRHLTSILEPILTIGLGAFVLILALAIFMPMWNLINVFKG
ncbi:MAG: type II secretion system F family protein [candidate division Zixibacteria bacterium]|nr:type II secretion system F family protein [candidate division Zixibacteria bacterium]MDH3937765.1 type II secretion system F family protein [candidate division Zixibacteria bacterium]